MYYSTGQEIPFANAIDAATTFIGGVGHQMELEAIRSRTKEALRARVRAGRIAGGRCFGYALKRETDPSGRAYTVAVVDDSEANVVRRIFSWYLEGFGPKKIASKLNSEGVRSPTAGRRGTNSWSPGCVREILRRERYRGLYRHGLIHRVRRGGKRVVVGGRPEEVIAQEIPEWRIVDDSIWLRVQELTTDRRRDVRAPGPARAIRSQELVGALRAAARSAWRGRREEQTAACPPTPARSTTAVATASARSPSTSRWATFTAH